MSWFKSFFLYLANFTSYAQILEFIRPSFMYIVYHIFDSISTKIEYMFVFVKKNCPFIYANGQFNTFIHQYHFRIRLDLTLSSRHLKNRGFPLVILKCIKFLSSNRWHDSYHIKNLVIKCPVGQFYSLAA